jgi:hypothetical protein
LSAAASAFARQIRPASVDPQYGSKRVLASLFHLAYIFARIIHKATDMLGSVAPAHADAGGGKA